MMVPQCPTCRGIFPPILFLMMLARAAFGVNDPDQRTINSGEPGPPVVRPEEREEREEREDPVTVSSSHTFPSGPLTLLCCGAPSYPT